MGTINYTVVEGVLPITASLLGSGLADNIHNDYEAGTFISVPAGSYTLRITDDEGMSKDYTITPTNGDDLFGEPICIVNEEYDVFQEGTAIIVEDVDTGANTIQLSYLPNIDTVCTPVAGEEWVIGVGLGPEPGTAGRDFAYLRVTGGNPVTRVLNYDLVRYEETFTVGKQVYLYNSYNNGWTTITGNTSPLIPKGTKPENSVAVSLRAIGEHSDGNYRGICTGYNGTVNTHMLYQSSDLENGSWVKSVISHSGTGDGRNNGSVVCNSIMGVESEGKYFCSAYGLGGNPSMLRTGWIKFDEDFNNLEYSAEELITDPIATLGFYEPSIIYHNCTYKLLCAARIGSDVLDWELWEGLSDTKEGPYTFKRVVLSKDYQDVEVNFMNSHSTETYPHIFNGKLYSLICGTSRFNKSGNRGWRQFGIMEFNDDTEEWVVDPKGIMIGSHQFADSIHSTYPGHAGAVPMLYQKDNTGYFFCSQTVSTDAYQVHGWKKTLENPA